MDQCLVRPVPDCGEGDVQTGKAGAFCPDWDACLPFGKTLRSRDGCVSLESSGTAPQDGVYDRIVVEGGCIVGAAGKQVEVYQPQACTNPPCDCGSGGGSSQESISPRADSILDRDASGALYAKIYTGTGSGAVISGDGTEGSPLVVDVDLPESVSYVQSGNSAIEVSGAGTQANPYRVSHAEGSGTVNAGGFSFDRYGHLTGYTPPSSAGTVNGVVGRRGVKAETDTATGIATVELEQPPVTARGDYRLGGFDVTIDEYNRVSVVDQAVEITPGARYMGAQLVTLTDSGTLQDIEDTTATRIVVYHKASKRFTGTNSVSMTFTTALVGSFRISMHCTSLTSAAVTVDGTGIAEDVFTADKLVEALTSARYALGQHTVAVSGVFEGPGYLDVEIVTGY